MTLPDFVPEQHDEGLKSGPQSARMWKGASLFPGSFSLLGAHLSSAALSSAALSAELFSLQSSSLLEDLLSSAVHSTELFSLRNSSLHGALLSSKGYLYGAPSLLSALLGAVLYGAFFSPEPLAP
jgi:hypothetical protein